MLVDPRIINDMVWLSCRGKGGIGVRSIDVALVFSSHNQKIIGNEGICNALRSTSDEVCLSSRGQKQQQEEEETEEMEIMLGGWMNERL